MGRTDETRVRPPNELHRAQEKCLRRLGLHIHFIHSLSGKSISLLGSSGGVKIDRKSTRLNSSHQIISYAVFCLKKKNDKAKEADERDAGTSDLVFRQTW